MATRTYRYFSELADQSGACWNLFWYQPKPPGNLLVLRQLVAVTAWVWVASFSLELTTLFGPAGAMTPDTVHRAMTSSDPTQVMYRFSHIFLLPPDLLWVAHIAALLIIGLLAAGIAPRWTCPGSLFVVLSYVHASPIMAGVCEPVLCMLLLYLTLLPAGGGSNGLQDGNHHTSSWRANLVGRLIQVHLCLFYVLIGTCKLGSTVWWTGESSSLLVANNQHSLFNLEYLVRFPWLMQAATHLWLLSELLFPVLIWIPLLRPLIVSVAIGWWLWTGVTTGLVGYAWLMTVAHLVFLPNLRQANRD